MKHSLFAATAVACLSIFSTSATGSTMMTQDVADDSPVEIKVGEGFPEIFLPRVDRDGFRSIADYRGEKVFLHVFASW